MGLFVGKDTNLTKVIILIILISLMIIKTGGARWGAALPDAQPYWRDEFYKYSYSGRVIQTRQSRPRGHSVANQNMNLHTLNEAQMDSGIGHCCEYQSWSSDIHFVQVERRKTLADGARRSHRPPTVLSKSPLTLQDVAGMSGVLSTECRK